MIFQFWKAKLQGPSVRNIGKTYLIFKMTGITINSLKGAIFAFRFKRNLLKQMRLTIRPHPSSPLTRKSQRAWEGQRPGCWRWCTSCRRKWGGIGAGGRGPSARCPCCTGRPGRGRCLEGRGKRWVDLCHFPTRKLYALCNLCTANNKLNELSLVSYQTRKYKDAKALGNSQNGYCPRRVDWWIPYTLHLQTNTQCLLAGPIIECIVCTNIVIFYHLPYM